MSSNNTQIITIDRDYSDNYSVKKYTEDVLVDKYFSDIDANLRTVGMIGFTTEQVSNISEDLFNTASVLFRETFPNRAQIPESIYSHAAIFQISDAFATAASCTFLMALEEATIIKNMEYENGYYHFYIDKDTTINVEEIPFVLDYGIDIKIISKKNEEGNSEYFYSATYIKDTNNSISSINDTYIKIRRSSDGYISLELKCHQCVRNVVNEDIITNNTINYPVIDIPFSSKLAGFDILYRAPSQSVFNTQLSTLVEYAQPIDTPFCYYHLHDENTLRITFNTRDDYFKPAYGSEIKVTLYETLGVDGNFDVYTGDQINVVKSEDSRYDDNYITAARPMTSSAGGKDSIGIDGLQSLAVEGYRTANALTTDADLSEYFRNWKYHYNDSDIMFIKKRNDIYERIYSAFIVMKKDNYIFKTNTMNMKMNLSEMKNPETNIFTIDPGVLFTSNNLESMISDKSAYILPDSIYSSEDTEVGYATFLRDKKKYSQYYAEYEEAVKNNEIPYIDDTYDKTELPAYLDRPASFAEFKKRKKYDDKISIFDLNEEEIYGLREYDNPQIGNFLYINPFLIRFKKNPNLVSLYMTYIDQRSLVDFKDNCEDSYVNFIIYQVRLQRNFKDAKKYTMSLNLMSSIGIESDHPLVARKEVIDPDDESGGTTFEYVLNDKKSTMNNDLRVFVVIQDKGENICAIEMYPSAYNAETENFTFTAEFYTDDHLTSEGKIRLVDNDDEYKIYNLSKRDDIVIPMVDVNCKIYTCYHRIYDGEDGLVEITDEFLKEHATMMDNLRSPAHELVTDLFDKYSDEVLTYYDEEGNEIQIKPMENMNHYISTDLYDTSSDPLTFLKPLNNVRANLIFKDYTALNNDNKYINDIMDIEISSLPFLRWSIIENLDNMSYFMTTFLAQYNSLIDVINTRLRNETSLDVKFYNTYGRSKEFTIGEEQEIINTVNLALSFDIWYIPGTDMLAATPEVKSFIKSEVETINTAGMNNLYISNLMRKIELKFAYVDHIRFNSINKYSTDKQAVKNYATDLEELTVEERRSYVPELLVIDTDDIHITEYYSS